MFSFSKSDNGENKKGWLQRLGEGLKRTKQQFSQNISNLFLGRKTIDADLFDTLEETLLLADVGAQATQEILKNLTAQTERQVLKDPSQLLSALQQQLLGLLLPCAEPLKIEKKPTVILMVGVNGAGKTTTIAKLAHYYQMEKKRVILAAGDTFRAAAIEQLQVWGNRNQVPVIAQQSGADSASVIYDAMQAAYARQYDILIADTAGRLHTQNHLMDELAKIKRVMKKLDIEAPHEVMLVIDASMGQNALRQAIEFHENIGITGITLTKLDGTAKGGIIFAIAKKLGIPIRFIGVGEQRDDLKPFHAQEFVNTLFDLK